MESNSTPTHFSRFTNTRLVKIESNRRWKSIRLLKRTADFTSAKQITSMQWTDVDSALISLSMFTKFFLLSSYIEINHYVCEYHISILKHFLSVWGITFQSPCRREHNSSDTLYSQRI